jgi:hypothetical protein
MKERERILNTTPVRHKRLNKFHVKMVIQSKVVDFFEQTYFTVGQRIVHF